MKYFSTITGMPDAEDAQKVTAIQVELTARAREHLASVKQEFGITQKAAVEMAVEFLGSLPPSAQREVYRRGGDAVGELVRLKETETAGGGDTIEQAAASIRKQLARLERMARSYRQELNDLHAGDTSKKKGLGKAGG